MLKDFIRNLKIKVWSKHFPTLTNRTEEPDDPYNYYTVYFRDIDDVRFFLNGVNDNPADGKRYGVLLETQSNKTLNVDLLTLVEMKSEIIHYRKESSSTYNNIFLFAFDYYTKILFIKKLVSRGKGALVSNFVSETRSLSHDRYAILKLLLSEYIKLRAGRENNGFNESEILGLIHGRLWYKHIRKEEYKVKLRLLLDSLVITGDLNESEKVYFIQSKSVNTIVEYEKELTFRDHQIKIQKNIFRFIVVLTALLAIIILVLLALAGIVNLPSIWQKILEIKPVRFLLKFI